MKPALLCLCLLAGCSSTLPVDAMNRIAHSVNAMREAYLALCTHREGEPECERIRGSINQAIDAYTAANDALAGEETPK